MRAPLRSDWHGRVHSRHHRWQSSSLRRLVLGPPTPSPHRGVRLLARATATVALDYRPSFTVAAVAAAWGFHIWHRALRRSLPPLEITAVWVGHARLLSGCATFEQQFSLLRSGGPAGCCNRTRANPALRATLSVSDRPCRLYTPAQMRFCTSFQSSGAAARSYGPLVVSAIGWRLLRSGGGGSRIARRPSRPWGPGGRGGRVSTNTAPPHNTSPRVSQNSCLGRSLHFW